MRQTLLTAASSTEGAIQRVAAGLEWADAEFVATALDVTLDRLADLCGIPRSTFYRRQAQGRFPVPESEHVMRFARLWQIAGEVFPSEKAARSWLSRGQYGLDGAVPLEFAKSELGARAVEDLMRRIHYGVLA
jgi:putative toxin-antitoxin system antitoxin component (TIGR02293 family)